MDNANERPGIVGGIGTKDSDCADEILAADDMGRNVDVGKPRPIAFSDGRSGHPVHLGGVRRVFPGAPASLIFPLAAGNYISYFWKKTYE